MLNLPTETEYTFERLEEFINNHPSCIALSVRDVEDGSNAIMHKFGGNFCGDWKSGDGILFYDNHEQHSAHSDDLFILKKIIYI